MDTRSKPTGPKLQFGQIQETDLPGVLAIEKLVNSAPWSERSFRNELNHEHGIFLIARSAGSIVAYGGVWLVIDEAHITNLAVSPELRRQGIGRQLMIEAAGPREGARNDLLDARSPGEQRGGD